MSLVAYDNSDDSEESDVSDNEENGRVHPLEKQSVNDSKLNGSVGREIHVDTRANLSPRIVNRIDESVHNNDADTHDLARNAIKSDEFEGHISDEEDEYLLRGNTETSALHLPPPRNEHGAGSSSIGHDAETSKSSLLLGLPAPKPTKVSSDSQPVLLASADDELDDLVKPKAAELASRQKPPSSKRKIIKIAAPSLDQYDSDEEAPAAKVLKPSKGGSGLFALLPEPKHVSKKEAGRSLVPHTLTKRPAPTKASVPKPDQSPKVTPVSIIPNLPDDDSEPEDDAQETTSNFFSFGSESSALNKPLNPSGSGVSEVPSSSLESNPVTGPVEAPDEQSHSKGDSSDFMDNNEPLQFNPKAASYVGPQRPSGSEMQGGYEEYMEATPQELEQECNDQDVSEPDIPVEELLRLQGRRQRGREAINLIDVQGATGTSTIELMKNLTQETNMQSHSRNKKDQPSTQEKRKHQITYLAHRAQEREFDLKNQWANNRASKKQTQSKYGF